MMLTERDQEILKALNDYRTLLAHQIEALFFTSKSATQYRLVRLYQHEFVDRHIMPIVSQTAIKVPIIYTLGKRGASVLTALCGYGREQIRPQIAMTWQVLDHLLQVNDIRIAVTLAAQHNQWRLEEWLDEFSLKANPDYVSIAGASKPVLPDGYFCLSVPQGKARFFLEVDRGTEPHHKFKPQIEVYEAYIRSGQYQERYKAKSLRILIVTTTNRRLASLQATVKKAGGSDRYWFTIFDQVIRIPGI